MNALRKLICYTRQFKNLNSSATRITKGMMAFSLSQLINFFIRIGLPPLYLNAWGIHRYGNWLILYSVAAYLSLSNLGGQTYLVNRLTQLFSQKKLREYRQVFNSGLLLFIVLAVVGLFLFAITIAFLPMAHLLHTPHIDPFAVKAVLLILAVQVLLAVPQGLLTGIYQSVGKLPFAVMLFNGMTFLQLLLCLSALLLKASPSTVALMHIIPLVLLTAFAIWHIPSQFRFPIFSLKSVKLELLKSFVKPSFNFLAIDLSTAFAVQGIIIMLGGLLGSMQIVMFTTMRTLINMMKQVLGVISFSSWREMTHYDAMDNREKLRLLFRSVLRTSLIAAILLATLLYFFAAPLYTLWLHHRVPFSQPLMDLFLLYGIEMVFWTACANLLMSTNRHHVLARVYLITAIISLAAAYFGGRYFGLHGVILALLFIDIIFPAWFIPYLLYRYDHYFNLMFFLRELLPIVSGILLILFLPTTTILLIPLLIYWWYRGLPLKILKAHLQN